MINLTSSNLLYENPPYKQTFLSVSSLGRPRDLENQKLLAHRTVRRPQDRRHKHGKHKLVDDPVKRETDTHAPRRANDKPHGPSTRERENRRKIFVNLLVSPICLSEEGTFRPTQGSVAHFPNRNRRLGVGGGEGLRRETKRGRVYLEESSGKSGSCLY